MKPVYPNIDTRKKNIVLSLGRYRQLGNLRYREVFLDGVPVGSFSKDNSSKTWSFQRHPDSNIPELQNWRDKSFLGVAVSLTYLKGILRGIVQSQLDARAADAIENLRLT